MTRKQAQAYNKYMLLTGLDFRSIKIFSRGLKNGPRVVLESEKKYFPVRTDKYGKQLINFFINQIKVRLQTVINYAGFATWCMLYTNDVTKCIRETRTFVGEPLNHIYQYQMFSLDNRCQIDHQDIKEYWHIKKATICIDRILWDNFKSFLFEYLIKADHLDRWWFTKPYTTASATRQIRY